MEPAKEQPVQTAPKQKPVKRSSDQETDWNDVLIGCFLIFCAAFVTASGVYFLTISCIKQTQEIFRREEAPVVPFGPNVPTYRSPTDS